MSARIKVTVTNTSSSRRFYGYLPPRGASLNPGQSKEFSFDLRSKMTPIELRALDRDVANNRIRYQVDLVTSTNVGSSAISGIKVEELGDGATHSTILTFTNVSLPITDPGTGDGFGNLAVYTFPEGVIQFLGASVNLSVSESSADIADNWGGNFSLGTAGITATGSLTGALANLLPSTTIPAATGGASTAKGASTSTQAPQLLSGASTPVAVFLNMLVGDSSISGNAPVTLNGKVVLVWSYLGDY